MPVNGLPAANRTFSEPRAEQKRAVAFAPPCAPGARSRGAVAYPSAHTRETGFRRPHAKWQRTARSGSMQMSDHALESSAERAEQAWRQNRCQRASPYLEALREHQAGNASFS